MKKLHPHMMPPEGDDVEIKSMEFEYKLPNAEDLIAAIAAKLTREDMIAVIDQHTNAVLDAAAEEAELFVMKRLSTQTYGELIGERIRKLKVKP